MIRKYVRRDGSILKTEYSGGIFVTVLASSYSSYEVCYFEGDESNPTFTYDGETFIVENYICYDVNTLIDKIKVGAADISDIFVTFSRYSKDLGVYFGDTLMRISKLENVMSSLFTSIIFRSVSKDEHGIVQYKKFYFNDFAEKLLKGECKLVSLDDSI